ncbi:hypothetical protein [Brevundimonas naejangsanensis]
MTPSLRRADPPRFAELTPDDFEEMCCSILDKEPGVTRADLYHTRFDAQYGIDAFGETPQGLIVVSCKRSQKIAKDDIAGWCEDFLQHWDDRWRAESVKRFVLAVTADTHHRNRIADIEAAKARFATFGLEFEVWSPRQLQEKLRGQPGMVSQYLGGRDWVERICDDTDIEAARTADAVRTDLKDRLDSFAKALTGEAEKTLDAAVLSLECGDVAEVETLLAELRSGVGWDNMPEDLRARIVRLQGSAALTRGDLDGAKAFSADADGYAISAEPRLTALIAMHEHGPAAGLAALGEPTTPKGRALRASLLLVTGRPEEAEVTLDALEADDPEVLRLRAYLHLQRGDRAAGLAAVERAEAIRPDTPAISRTLATALYAQALSPLAPPPTALSPNPLNWMLIRRDDVSTGRLEQALERFRRLAAGDPLRQSRWADEAWVLACLGNLPARREEAAAQAARMLAADPRDIQVIGWVLMRDLEVDLTPARAALTQALQQGDLAPGEAQTLDWLTDETDEPALLALVEGALAGGVAETVRAEVESVRDRLGAAPSGDEIVPATLEAAHRTGDWTQAEVQFEAAISADPPPFTALTQASALSAGGRWSVLARHRGGLQRFATAAASRIAAIAAYNDGDPLGALEILSADAGLFPGGRLPFDLRRVEAEALAQVGDPLQAVSRAAALAADSRTVTDGLREARLRLNLGDVEGAIPKVKAALEGDALEPEDALVWSQTLASQDPELARDLWRHAVNRDLDDAMAFKAYGLSFNLGVEGEKPDLLAAVGRLAEEGKGVWKITIDELVEEMGHRRERAEDLDDKWKRAVAPTHFLAQASGASLAEIYNLTPMTPRPLFLRAGSRGDADIDPAPVEERRYYLDISALLIAHQLDLLPVLESLGPRLHIAAATSHALMEIERTTRHHQPGRGMSARRILSEAGRRIGLEPPTDARTVAHDGDAPEDGFALGQVLSGIEADGAASPELLEHWRAALPASAPASSWPLPGASLVISDGALDSLFEMGAFDVVASTYAVFIDPPSLTRARALVDALQRTANLVLAISRLRRRIARQAEAHYAFVGRGAQDSDPNDDAFSKSAVGRSLAEIMAAAGESPMNRLWVEDRFLSSFAHAGQAPIVGALDILGELRRAGRIDDEGYFERLMRLRQGGALFLPVETAEIDHHLLAAEVRDGVVVETEGLAALRRNVALAHILADKLRLVPTGEPDDRPLELPFLLHLRRICEAAVIARWNAQTSVDTARAQCDWIWRCLRAENLPRPGSVGDAAAVADGAETIAALNFAGLVAAAFQLRGAYGDPSWKRREHYLAWLNDSVLTDRLSRDPGTAARTIDWARDLFRLDDMEGQTLNAKAREGVRALTRGVLTQLPETLRDAMAADPGFMQDLGFGETTAITVEDKTFAASVFWTAVADAMNDESGTAPFSDEDGRVAIRRAADEPWRIDLTGDLVISLRDSNFGLLSRDPEVRQASLTALFDECDILPEDRSELDAAILGEPQPDRRIQLARKVRDRSVRLYLEGLAAALQTRNDVGVEAFDPPAARDWLTYVRWRDPETRIEAAVDRLRQDIPPAAVVGRTAGLPFTPPDILWAGVALDGLRSITPVAQIQRLRAVRRGLVPSADADLPAEILATAEAVSRLGGLYVALLHWGAEAFSGQDGWSELSPIQKHVVTWCFADRLTDILGSLGLEGEDVIGFFRTQKPRRDGVDLLRLEHGYSDSSLHPAAVNGPALLMAGLEYALGDDAPMLTLPQETVHAVARGLGVSPEASDRRPSARVFPARPEVGATWMDRPTAGAIIEGHDLEAILGQAIDALEKIPSDEKAWVFIFNMGLPVLPETVADRLVAVLQQLDPTALVCGAQPVETLRYAAEAAGRFAGEDIGEAFLGRLSAFAPKWLKGAHAAEFSTRLEGLVEAAAAAARSYEGTGPWNFADFIIRLVNTCPEAAPAIRDILDALIDRTPVRHAESLWKALRAARAV